MPARPPTRGVPAFEWIDDLFDRVADVPAWAIAAGVLLESARD